MWKCQEKEAGREGRGGREGRERREGKERRAPVTSVLCTVPLERLKPECVSV